MFNVLKRRRALYELRRELREAGFVLYQPIEDLAIKLGAEVGVLMEDPTNSGFKEKKSADAIRDINIELAKRHNLTAVGVGPAWVENAVSVVFCGFRRQQGKEGDDGARTLDP